MTSTTSASDDQFSLSGLRAELEDAGRGLAEAEKEVRLRREHLDRLTRAIAALEAVREVRSGHGFAGERIVATMSAVGRATAELERAGKELSTRELVDKMTESGYVTAGSGYDVVYSTLKQAMRRPSCPIVKVGTKWALRKWTVGDIQGEEAC